MTNPTKVSTVGEVKMTTAEFRSYIEELDRLKADALKYFDELIEKNKELEDIKKKLVSVIKARELYEEFVNSSEKAKKEYINFIEKKGN